MKVKSPSFYAPKLSSASFSDMNALREYGTSDMHFRFFTPEKKNRSEILNDGHLEMSCYDIINPYSYFYIENRWNNLYEDCKIYRPFKFLLDSNSQLVIKSDVNENSDTYLVPYIGIIFDDDSSIYFAPFKCFCQRSRRRTRFFLLSDNAPSVFGGNITNELMFLSFQKMKYHKFVLDCWIKEDKNFKHGILYESIYKLF